MILKYCKVCFVSRCRVGCKSNKGKSQDEKNLHYTHFTLTRDTVICWGCNEKCYAVVIKAQPCRYPWCIFDVDPKFSIAANKQKCPRLLKEQIKYVKYLQRVLGFLEEFDVIVNLSLLPSLLIYGVTSDSIGMTLNLL